MTGLERLRAGRHNQPERTGKRLSAEMDDIFLHYINQGEGLAQGCLATLHAGEPWGRAETRAVRQWRKQAKSVAHVTSSPLDVIQRIARRG
jgi:hypothetical protein